MAVRLPRRGDRWVTREEYAELSSTQDRAIELVRAGAAEGSRVVARRQTAGRGRLDHRWTSPEGGLYVSVVLRDPPPPRTILPLAVGASLLDSLRSSYDLPLRLKWPNDLLVVRADGAPGKIAGILVDRLGAPELGSAAVVGIGLNVRAPPPKERLDLGPKVAFLSEFVDPVPGLERLEEEVVAATIGASRTLGEPHGAEAVRRRCERELYGVGRTAVVDGRLVGRIEGIGPDGELMLDTGFERVSIREGDVSIREAS
jgi:BirA family biotin operon repressor/biotin-[acetyl-CoA-carboxylase] ligase